MSITLTQLECFRAVARRRHFAKAAASLARTQPALSVQIQRLEAELGVTLFDRTGKQVLLTPAGEILLPYAERVLTSTQEARVVMSAKRGSFASSGRCIASSRLRQCPSRMQMIAT